MSRFDRRIGSTSSVTDAVSQFKKSLDDTPAIGRPRVSQLNSVARPGEILVIKTTDGNKIVHLDSAMQAGDVAYVLNDGTGQVTVYTPTGMTFADGSTSDVIVDSYEPRSYIRIDSKRFAIFGHLSLSTNVDIGGTLDVVGAISGSTGTALTFVDRGDPAADYDHTTLTIDNAYHDLVLSTPANSLVLIYGRCAPGATTRTLRLRKKGRVNDVNRAYYRFLANLTIGFSTFVQCDANSTIEYKVDGAVTSLYLTIAGWFTGA